MDGFDRPASEELHNNVEAVISFGESGLLFGRERQGAFSSAVFAGQIRCNYQLAADAFIQQGRFERGDYHVAFKNCHMFCRSVLGSFNIPATFRFGFTPLWRPIGTSRTLLHCSEEDLIRVPSEVQEELTAEQICLAPTIAPWLA
ncbi:hypothetical protein AK812_SmicGene7229 [Symbiodinium microadriaticum]|uniref:PPPDE domain-containing protein n=1 Tax=Symbiodinium microadriaticum TaxID=2951 RepID=A0A1Q9EP11_SYMMI|nr:hypothetical protein AK812_SmicGene7229 [Symbiodinium microadriaticum]